MVGLDLVANCAKFNGSYVASKLPNAHSCGADIANLNGKLLCNPTVRSFAVTCDTIAVANDMLSARCLKSDSVTYMQSTLNVAGYGGSLISNCNGLLTTGSC